MKRYLNLSKNNWYFFGILISVSFSLSWLLTNIFNLNNFTVIIYYILVTLFVFLIMALIESQLYESLFKTRKIYINKKYKKENKEYKEIVLFIVETCLENQIYISEKSIDKIFKINKKFLKKSNKKFKGNNTDEIEDLSFRLICSLENYISRTLNSDSNLSKLITEKVLIDMYKYGIKKAKVEKKYFKNLIVLSLNLEIEAKNNYKSFINKLSLNKFKKSFMNKYLSKNLK